MHIDGIELTFASLVMASLGRPFLRWGFQAATHNFDLAVENPYVTRCDD